MSTDRPRAADAQRHARQFFAKDKQRPSAWLVEKTKADAATAAKTARLRALRLEKESADRDAAAAKAERKRAKQEG